MGKNICRRLVARPELDNTFWTDSTGVEVKIKIMVFKSILIVKRRDADINSRRRRYKRKEWWDRFEVYA